MEQFKYFAGKRIVIGVLLTLALLWVAAAIIGLFDPSPEEHTAAVTHEKSAHSAAPGESGSDLADEQARLLAEYKELAQEKTEHGGDSTEAVKHAEPDEKAADAHKTPEKAEAEADHTTDAHSAAKPAAEPEKHKAEDTHGTAHGVAPFGEAAEERVTGVAFVEAVIEPMHYELKERWWGWRPNDILDFTDNVNNFQLGVLEVTRRTAVALDERISRTGSTAALDPHLENAVNWLMVKPHKYWFPSPESKYRDSLKELGLYKEKLERGEATFYTRPDNLIPLLASFEDLLGSCDENLVREHEEDGQPVSFFSADDYFFYSKGVASSMKTVLEAVHEDFSNTLQVRHGSEILHHALESLDRATKIDPWIVCNSDLSSVIANHRANMAAPISHARFYLGVLIKALST